MVYAVANVTAALDSISQICDTGATVTFGRHGGYIKQNNGLTIPFQREGDTYTRRVWVEPKGGNSSTSFTRPGPKDL